MAPIMFREVQPFWHNRLALLTVVLVSVPILGQAVRGRGGGPFTALAVLGAGVPLALLALRLVTTVDADRVVVRFPPLRGSRIPLGDIVSAEDGDYSPLREFGGWGFRVAAHGKRAYNVSGRQGVRLHLADGRQLVIGSRRPGELRDAIDRAAG